MTESNNHRGRQAGTFKEVDITPEMLERGVSALMDFDLVSVADGWDSKHEVVRAVLCAVFPVYLEGRLGLDKGREPDEIEITPEMVEAMTDYFWEWRGENAEAAIYAEAPPDMASLFRGLYCIQKGFLGPLAKAS